MPIILLTVLAGVVNYTNKLPTEEESGIIPNLYIIIIQSIFIIVE